MVEFVEESTVDWRGLNIMEEIVVLVLLGVTSVETPAAPEDVARGSAEAAV